MDSSIGPLSLLNPVTHASYTRNRKLSPPDSDCLPGTRKEVIKELKKWTSSSNLFDSDRIMWLYGYVGCGKSALAQAVADDVAKSRKLAASFFFFRGSGDRSKASRFATTVAYQVAMALPHTASFIESAIKELDYDTMTLGAQFRKLVYEPIRSSTGRRMGLDIVRSPYLIIVDGLDECDDKEDIADFIDHSLRFFDEHPSLPLRLLISSRVQEHIQTRLQHRCVRRINLASRTSTADIAIALKVTFESAVEHDRVLKSRGEWPDAKDLELLVQHIGGSFIFMSTIAKFILSPSNDNLTPFERLPMALNISPGLDGLYIETLSRSQHYPHFLSIVNTLALLKEPVSIVELAHLLQLETFEVVQVLVNLHAILQVPGDDFTPVTLCHSSLRDFLTTETRGGPFFASDSHHGFLAQRCVEVRAGPRDNPAMLYADRHWMSHFRLANDDCVLDDTYTSLLNRASTNPHHFHIIATLTHLRYTRVYYKALISIISTVQKLSGFTTPPQLTVADIEAYFEQNHALVSYDELRGARLSHASLKEFLIDPVRSDRRAWFVHPAYHRKLAYACMAKLDNTRGAMDPARKYSKQHWEEHWRLAIHSADMPADNTQIRYTWIRHLFVHLREYFPGTFKTIITSYILLAPMQFLAPSSTPASALVGHLSETVDELHINTIIKAFDAVWRQNLQRPRLVSCLAELWDENPSAQTVVARESPRRMGDVTLPQF